MKNYIEFYNKQRMPILGLGVWQVEDDDPERIDADAIEKALDAGYRHFDTSVLYGNEKGLGRALKKHLDSGKLKREEIFIVTKLPWIGMHPGRVSQFLLKSLKNLQLDYIDLYLIHWPTGVKYTLDEELVPLGNNGKVLLDTTTNLEATWRAMEFQVDAGRVMSIGLSNFNPGQIDRIMDIARIPPAIHQFEIHAHFQNKDWVAASRKHNISVCAYGPFAKNSRRQVHCSCNESMYKRNRAIGLMEDPVVVKIAKRHGKSPTQILLRFLLQLEIAVIPNSTTNAEHLRQNFDIFDMELSPREMKELEGIDKGEAGRSFPVLPGIKDHPECPF